MGKKQQQRQQHRRDSIFVYHEEEEEEGGTNQERGRKKAASYNVFAVKFLVHERSKTNPFARPCSEKRMGVSCHAASAVF